MCLKYILLIIRMACRCLWDSDTDSYAQDVFMNVSYCAKEHMQAYFYPRTPYFVLRLLMVSSFTELSTHTKQLKFSLIIFMPLQQYMCNKIVQ